MDYVHPETGEVLASEEDWRAALEAVQARLSEQYRLLWPLQEAYAERFPAAALPERRRDRTETQEKVARCPRCGGKLSADQE